MAKTSEAHDISQQIREARRQLRKCSDPQRAAMLKQVIRTASFRYWEVKGT